MTVPVAQGLLLSLPCPPEEGGAPSGTLGSTRTAAPGGRAALAPQHFVHTVVWLSHSWRLGAPAAPTPRGWGCTRVCLWVWGTGSDPPCTRSFLLQSPEGQPLTVTLEEATVSRGRAPAVPPAWLDEEAVPRPQAGGVAPAQGQPSADRSHGHGGPACCCPSPPLRGLRGPGQQSAAGGSGPCFSTGAGQPCWSHTASRRFVATSCPTSLSVLFL